MKTYQDFKQLMSNLQPNQKIIFGATHPFFIKVLIELAKSAPDNEYIIPYSNSPGGCGYEKIKNLALLYSEYSFPDNILFEESFAELVLNYKQMVNN